MSEYTVPDQYSKKELSSRLRIILDDLERVSDEIIMTYLSDDKNDDVK